MTNHRCWLRIDSGQWERKWLITNSAVKPYKTYMTLLMFKNWHWKKDDWKQYSLILAIVSEVYSVDYICCRACLSHHLVLEALMVVSPTGESGNCVILTLAANLNWADARLNLFIPFLGLFFVIFLFDARLFFYISFDTTFLLDKHKSKHFSTNNREH